MSSVVKQGYGVKRFRQMDHCAIDKSLLPSFYHLQLNIFQSKTIIFRISCNSHCSIFIILMSYYIINLRVKFGLTCIQYLFLFIYNVLS